MAKVRKNIVVKGFSGKLGNDLVFRQNPDGQTIAAVPPTYPDGRVPTPAMKVVQDHFREATIYAKGAKNLPEYADLAKKEHKSSYAVAVADFLHVPEIHSIDAEGYTGLPQQIIKIRASDDVKVTSVLVVIVGVGDVLVEKGQAVQDTLDTNRWTYTTTASAGTPHVTILVDASDIPGNVTEKKLQI